MKKQKKYKETKEKMYYGDKWTKSKGKNYPKVKE
ncbi:MAG: hypothetical protein [Podoviridae sp. cty5g4]|nr:MAG: hypothetical protein [Podoviridae sp. cty5g4]